MKKLSFLLLLCALCFSCNKATDEKKDSSTASFTITGVHDVDLSVSSTGTYILPVSVNLNAGAKPDTVALSVNGLPAGVYAEIKPAVGTPTYASVITLRSDFTGPGGTFPCNVTGNGSSGSKSYDFTLSTTYYRGWDFGGTVYNKTSVTRDTGKATGYPYIAAYSGPGVRLLLHFPYGSALPTANKTYKIASSASAPDVIQVELYDYDHIYNATGTNSPTGTFTFDTLGKFTFKCTNVDLSNGSVTRPLSCSFSE